MGMHALVLAGGSGKRLWPLSQEILPKHLLALDGSQSLLQQTIKRLLKFLPARNIWTVTLAEQGEQVGRQLAEVDSVLVKNLLLEPAQRNTLPAIALGVRQICQREKEALIGVFPSDHVVLGERKFREALKKGIQVAKRGFLVTFGIPPLYPATGYGYIQVAAMSKKSGACKIQSFVEKPDIKKAILYLNKGNYFWNAGMFVFSGSVFLQELKRVQSGVYRAFMNGQGLADIYAKLSDNMSVDCGVFEKTKKGVVIPATFGWQDLGNWEAVYTVSPKDGNENVSKGKNYSLDTKNSLLLSEEGCLATIGLRDMVVVNVNGTVLVSPRRRAHEIGALVKNLNLNQPQSKGVDARPWGGFTVLDESNNYKVKRIVIQGGEALSLQTHRHRSEHWVVVEGKPIVTVGMKKIQLKPNQSVFIPSGTPHRIENKGSESVQMIEVQYGRYLGEDDIVRLEDRYGRA